MTTTTTSSSFSISAVSSKGKYCHLWNVPQDKNWNFGKTYFRSISLYFKTRFFKIGTKQKCFYAETTRLPFLCPLRFGRCKSWLSTPLLMWIGFYKVLGHDLIWKYLLLQSTWTRWDVKICLPAFKKYFIITKLRHYLALKSTWIRFDITMKKLRISAFANYLDKIWEKWAASRPPTKYWFSKIPPY